MLASDLLKLIKAQEKHPTWSTFCHDLQQSDNVPLFPAIEEMLSSILAQGTTLPQRPFYLTVAKTLAQCREHDGNLPAYLLSNPVALLNVTNMARLYAIQDELKAIFASAEAEEMERWRVFLFEFLEPADWRIFLHLRTTVGGRSLDVMPPSLLECLSSFVKVYEKPNAKPRRGGGGYQLTVGAKALSKHWHRDRGVGFWGQLTGSEEAKNKHANKILCQILTDAVWINLHCLPHEDKVYEVRQRQGYGARWIKQEVWQFRGFLEPQMEEGHAVGWVHGE